MKKFIFIILLTVIVLFAIGTVAADDNVSTDSLDVASDDNPIDEHTDLSVTPDKEEITGEENDTISYKVYVKNAGGIAYNTTVSHEIPKDLKLISYSSTNGEYHPDTGIWSLGNVEDNEENHLTINVKIINKKYDLQLEFWAKTDSSDENQKNDYTYILLNRVYAVNVTVATEKDEVPPTHEIWITPEEDEDPNNITDDYDSSTAVAKPPQEPKKPHTISRISNPKNAKNANFPQYKENAVLKTSSSNMDRVSYYSTNDYSEYIVSVNETDGKNKTLNKTESVVKKISPDKSKNDFFPIILAALAALAIAGVILKRRD